MTASNVTITFNGNYIHSSYLPYSVFDIGMGENKYNRRCIDGKITGWGIALGIAL
ncbi:MAG: hypothetical protein ACI4J7_03955 [Ruminiclostridium sp.]